MTLQVATLFSLIYLKSLRQVGAGEGTRGLKKGGGEFSPQSTQKAQVRVVFLRQDQLRLRDLWGKPKSVCESAPGEGRK